MDVPLMVLVSVSLWYQAAVMSEPGANKSRQVPKLENDERWSSRVLLPTVMASRTRFGEPLQASASLLPAATTKVTPRSTAPLTASSSASELPPPSDMFATAGGW
ncbi:MAG: hypothetical protein R6W86_04285 [Marinobacter sp.]